MLFFLAFVVSIYFGMKFINEIKTFGVIGTTPTQNTIDVSGEGDVTAAPDVATINFNVEAQGKTAETAQNLVTIRINQALDFLKNANVASADVQTTDYNVSPQYSQPCNGNIPCVSKPNEVPQIVSYLASENVSVKIRDITAVGNIVDGLGGVGITGISGPDFAIDNPDAVQDQAKQKAIDDAKQKAAALASELGVHLGKIVRFSDNDSTGNPMPMMYDAATGMANGAVAMAPTSALPSGQNKYTSSVTITYEIY